MWRQLQALNLYLPVCHSASVFYLGLHACVFLSWHFRKIGTFCHFPLCRCTGRRVLFSWELVLSWKRRIFSILKGQIKVTWTCAWSPRSQRQRAGWNLNRYLRERGGGGAESFSPLSFSVLLEREISWLPEFAESLNRAQPGLWVLPLHCETSSLRQNIPNRLNLICLLVIQRADPPVSAGGQDMLRGVSAAEIQAASTWGEGQALFTESHNWL